MHTCNSSLLQKLINFTFFQCISWAMCIASKSIDIDFMTMLLLLATPPYNISFFLAVGNTTIHRVPPERPDESPPSFSRGWIWILLGVLVGIIIISGILAAVICHINKNKHQEQQQQQHRNNAAGHHGDVVAMARYEFTGEHAAPPPYEEAILSTK